MKAALKVLRDQGRDKKKVVVLGKINYLGAHEKKYYREIARMLFNYDVDYLITLDDDSKLIVERALELGMDPHRIIHCDSNEYLRYVLESLLDDQTIVLFKFSLLDKSHNDVINSLITN